MPLIYEVTGLPAGLSFNTSLNRIEGTLADGETSLGEITKDFTITVKATDTTDGSSKTRTFDWRYKHTELVTIEPDKEKVELALVTSSTFQPQVDWGDGDTDTATAGAGGKKLAHTYSGAPTNAIVRYDPQGTDAFNLMRMGDLASGEDVGAIDLLTLEDAKGAYDVFDPSTLKTDLVASFTDASAEYLSRNAFTPTAGLSAYTVSFWVNSDASGIVEFLLTNLASDDAALTFLKNGQNKFRLLHSADGAASTVVETTQVADGGWHLITGVYEDGGDLAIYFDGVLSDSIAAPAPANATSGPFYIGGSPTSSLYTDSEMSDVAVWGRAFTAAEITTLYNGGTMQRIPDSLSAGGVSYWPLNEPRGMRYDRWGSNHLTDNNTVGAAHGSVEYQADDYAGVSNIISQGLAASPFGDLASLSAGSEPQLIAGALVYDGTSSQQGLQTIIGSCSQPNTIIVVFEMDSSILPLTKVFDSGLLSGRQFFAENNGDIDAWAGSYLAGPLKDTAQHVAIITANGASSRLVIDGVVYTGDMGTNDLDGLTLGSDYNGLTPMDGKIKDCTIIDRALTTSEENAITALLSV